MDGGIGSALFGGFDLRSRVGRRGENRRADPKDDPAGSREAGDGDAALALAALLTALEPDQTLNTPSRVSRATAC